MSAHCHTEGTSLRAFCHTSGRFEGKLSHIILVIVPVKNAYSVVSQSYRDVQRRNSGHFVTLRAGIFKGQFVTDWFHVPSPDNYPDNAQFRVYFVIS